MKEHLTLLGAVIAIVLATMGFVIVTKQEIQADKPIPVSARSIESDPAFYEGAQVSISTDGFEQDGPNRFIFRKRTDLPPSITLDFDAPVELPKESKKVVGKCLGRKGDSVIISNCRFE